MIQKAYEIVRNIYNPEKYTATFPTNPTYALGDPVLLYLEQPSNKTAYIMGKLSIIGLAHIVFPKLFPLQCIILAIPRKPFKKFTYSVLNLFIPQLNLERMLY